MSDSLRKAVSILDALRFAREGTSARVLSAQTGIPRSTVQRLLQTLEESQMVVQDAERLTYRLGPKTLTLGMAYKQGLDLGRIALPVMTALRDETSETVGLSVVNGHDRMFIEEVQSQSELRFASELGRQYPVWSGAPGRTLMMDFSAERLNRVLEEVDAADGSIFAKVNAETILTFLQETRVSGYAMAFNETLDNVSALAVPVRDFMGSIVASLSLSGPSARLTSDRMADVLPSLWRAASVLEASLGGAGISPSPYVSGLGEASGSEQVRRLM